jgi:hypothetical protein
MPEIVERITRIGNTAVHLAQEENRRKGIPNVYCINGKIVWQMPDGTISLQEPLEGITPDPKAAQLLRIWYNVSSFFFVAFAVNHH